MPVSPLKEFSRDCAVLILAANFRFLEVEGLWLLGCEFWLFLGIRAYAFFTA